MVCVFGLMRRRPTRSTQCRSSAASDVYKRQSLGGTPITASLISITTSGTGLSGSGTGAGTSVSTIRVIANSNLQSAGDYKIRYSASGVGVDQIKVIATGSGVRGSNSGVWTLPQ